MANDKRRAIEVFKYMVQFLEVFGQENYGGSAEVSWPDVFIFCNKYHMLDFNESLEDVIYAESEEEFRDKCFSWMEMQILGGYPVWRLFKMSDWLSGQLEKEMLDNEQAKDKKYFKSVKCYHCKHFTDNMSIIDKNTGFSYHLDTLPDNKKNELLSYNTIIHFMDCKERTRQIEIAKGDNNSHRSRDPKLSYKQFNFDQYTARGSWKLNPSKLKRCPYYEDNGMTYEQFLEKYYEILRYE